MKKNLRVKMWSSSSTDLNNLDLVLDHQTRNFQDFEPTPYTFTKLEKGKKIAVDSTSIIPPSWLLLDHTIAVIWSMFSLNQCLQQLNIDDLKWAYEFLKRIRNKKGENPPDVKVCLKEIQDRLINLYARLTSMKDALKAGDSIPEDFNDIAAAFGEKIMAETSPSFNFSSLMPRRDDSKMDTLSLYGSFSPSRTNLRQPYISLFGKQSTKDVSRTSKHKRISMNYSKKAFPLLEKDSNIFEEPEIQEDEEVENYILSLFADEKKDDGLEAKPSLKSLIPTKKKTQSTLVTEVISGHDISSECAQKSSKKVHCVAEMRSVKFRKSMKVQDIKGEEAAYSNLKAEIQRLTINPNVSRDELKKFLKGWRLEQVSRLQNELKRLKSIEEFVKTVGKDGVEPNLRMNSPLALKDLDTTKTNYSLCKS